MAEAKRYVRAARGKYTRRRWACIWLTQLAFFGLPWTEWNGQPAIWLDLPARRLTLFGSGYGPHDLVWLLAVLLLALLALLYAGTLAGRMFCGYACPHSVYGEIFMWIERRIEGKPLARLRLDRGALSGARLCKKAAKHCAWLAFALWTGFTLAAYFTPAPQLLARAAQGALGGWQLACIGAYAGLAYVNAGSLRAHFCRFICPWGRFQSLVIGPATLVMGYDRARGEPRALRNRKRLARAEAAGDCIDCTLCVQVCPTGADIRRGQLFDCIGCGACADACDQVMDKIGAPRGLVGYRRARPGTGRARSAALAALLVLGLLGVGWAVDRRATVRLALQHDRAVPLRELDGGKVANLYRMHVTNTGRAPRRFEVRVFGTDGPARASPAQLVLPGGADRVLPLRITVVGRAARPGVQRIRVALVDGEGRGAAQEAVFFASAW